MANSLYKQGVDPLTWFNQAQPGGPSLIQVRFNILNGNWEVNVSYNGEVYILFQTFATQAAAVTAVTNYLAGLAAGTQ